MSPHRPRPAIGPADELDLLSAIWILASNDENAIITYEGLKYRLGLPEAYDVRGLVRSRAELFRHTVPSHRLEAWKREMIDGKHLPSFIKAIDDDQERRAKIQSIGGDDVFRSQFRAEAGAAKSPLDVLDWGLGHIDRLRKAAAEKREESIKRWSSIRIPIITATIALAAILSSAFMQANSNRTQVELKRYEVTFKTKQEAYSTFMTTLLETFQAASNKNLPLVTQDFDKLEKIYYTMEPFFSNSQRTEVWDKFQAFQHLCLEMMKVPGPPAAPAESRINSLVEFKTYFRANLYKDLFPDK